MSNTISMSADFERQKNIQASALTGGLAGALVLLFILVKWSIPVEEHAQPEEYIEVNLGSGDTGSGMDQPQLPGEPAPARQTAYSPPTHEKATEESVKDVEANENSHDAPPIIKPTVSKPEVTKINEESKTVKTNTNPTPQPVVQAPPRPKAVLGHTIGGNGNGGNGADSYKPGT